MRRAIGPTCLQMGNRPQACRIAAHAREKHKHKHRKQVSMRIRHVVTPSRPSLSRIVVWHDVTIDDGDMHVNVNGNRELGYFITHRFVGGSVPVGVAYDTIADAIVAAFGYMRTDDARMLASRYNDGPRRNRAA